MKKVISILFLGLAISCNSHESSKAPEDSTVSQITDSKDAAPSIDATNSSKNTEVINTASFQSEEDVQAANASAVASPNRVWTFCCNSKGHVSREMDNCGIDWKYPTYPACNAVTTTHKRNFPNHDCGCR